MLSCFKGKFKVTSPRGYRTLLGQKEYHGGIDVVALDDKNVYAIANGTVDAVRYEANGFGHYVRQLLPDGRRIYYAHMLENSIGVSSGQKIKKGDKLGVMGSTGRSTAPHCHIELRVAGTSKESLDISAFTEIPNAVGTYISNGKFETGKEIINQIINEYNVRISEKQRAIQAVEKAKNNAEYLSLYWILYKLVNENE